MAEKTNLQREDFSKWYIQTIQKADLMDYSPVRGCMIFKSGNIFKRNLTVVLKKKAFVMHTSQC